MVKLAPRSGLFRHEPEAPFVASFRAVPPILALSRGRHGPCTSDGVSRETFDSTGSERREP